MYTCNFEVVSLCLLCPSMPIFIQANKVAFFKYVGREYLRKMQALMSVSYLLVSVSYLLVSVSPGMYVQYIKAFSLANFAAGFVMFSVEHPEVPPPEKVS